MSSLSTIPKGDSAWLLRKAVQRIMQQVSVLETNIGTSTTGNSANTQIIFNDAGTLRGDAQFTWNKTLNRLTIDGDEIITGELTVASNALKVTSDKVGIVQATPLYPLHLVGEFGLEEASPAGTGTKLRFIGDATKYNFRIGKQLNVSNGFEITPSTALGGTTFSNPVYTVTNDGIHTFLNGAGGTRMTLDSTGLGVGASPNFKLDVAGAANSAPITLLRLNNTGTTGGGPGIAARLQFNAGATALGFVQGSNFASGSIGVQISGDGTNIHQTIDSSGNVGIGVTPSAWNNNYNAIDIGANGSIAGRLGASNTVDITSNAFRNSAGDWIYKIATSNPAARYQVDGSTGSHIWYSGAAGTAGNIIAGFSTAAMTLNASGNLVFPSAKGIDFSAVTGGTGTATGNVLNDYEEGTWTATLKGSVSDPTTPVTATGRYTKVGRQVTVQVYISNVVTTGASGRIGISGLPFANNGSTETVGAVGLYDIATFTGSPFAQVGFNATQVDLYSSVSNSPWQAVTHNAGNARYLWFNMTYTV